MKKNIFTVLLLCVAAVLSATEPTVQLWQNGSLVYEKAIDKVDSITFPESKVFFWRNGLAAQYPVSPGDNLTYSYANFYDSFHQNPDYLYDIDSVPEITLTVTAANWNKYLSNFDANPNNDKYIPAAFTYKKGGRTFTRDSVGLRPRGNTSRRRPEGYEGQAHSANAQWHHAHFGVRFTKYTTGERFFGSDRVILKWFKEDPSYAREVFCYDLMRRFGVWTAPRVCYCRLSIQVIGDPHPVYMGVYELIENPRKGWLKARKDAGYIPDNDGDMWKGNYGCSLNYADNSVMGIEEDNLSFIYALKIDKDSLTKARNELQAFINGLGSHSLGSASLKTWLENNMDVDVFLRALAVEVMVGHWDDYWGNINNTFFYFDLQHKMYYIPFDMDNTLGTGLGDYGNPGTKDLLNWDPRDDSRRLVHRVLSIPEYEQRFKEYIWQIAKSDSLMEPTAAMARVQSFQNRIRNYVSNDTGEDMVIEDKPASWGKYTSYRLLSGSIGTGEGSSANFFKTKVNSISFSDPADPVTTPTVQAQSGKVVLVFHFAVAPCNTVVLSGAYQWKNGNQTYSPNWESYATSYATLTAIAGYTNWYKVEINKPTSGSYVVKPVQLSNNGGFDWQYQWNTNAEITSGNGASITYNSWDEPQVDITSSASVIYVESGGWKNNPCQ